MHQKALFLFIPLLFLFSGCCTDPESEYINIDSGDFFNYHIHDTLIYTRSDNTKADTFVVSDYETGYRIYSYTYHYQYENIDLYLLSDSAGYDFTIYHEKIKFDITWADYTCSGYFSDNLTQQNLIINQDTISDAYIFSNSNDSIRIIYYQFNYGIIAYINDSSEMYTLKLNTDKTD